MIYDLFGYPVNNPNLTRHTWLHIKTKGVYRVLVEGMLEADKTPVVIYQNVKTGEVWVRPRSEFMDGRFEQFDPFA